MLHNPWKEQKCSKAPHFHDIPAHDEYVNIWQQLYDVLQLCWSSPIFGMQLTLLSVCLLTD